MCLPADSTPANPSKNDWNNILWRPDDDLTVLPANPNGDIWHPEYLDVIEKAIDAASQGLRKLSLDIHAKPELGYEEHNTHDLLTDFMSSQPGWTVTRNYKLPTAWLATFEHNADANTRTIGVNSEMDALPKIGHACGHNLIAISGVAVALGIKAVLEHFNLPGKISLLGTPAEEGGRGKVKLIDAGGYDGIAACLMSHPAPGPKNTVSLTSCLALKHIEAEFTGKTAHAALSPWEGTNALDAAVLAYMNIAAMRQQMHPTWRVHGIFEGRDWAVNVIPEYAKYKLIVRAPTRAEQEVAMKKVLPSLEAAALSTGCQVKIEVYGDTLDLRQNRALGDDVANTFTARYGRVERELWGIKSASTDFGNVTYDFPALHPGYAIPTVPDGGNHTPMFASAATTEDAHRATLDLAKALALTGVRVVRDDEFYGKVKDTFEFDKEARKRGVIGV
ncbi:aminoacylase 1-like protein 2 [Moniliophthora roreri MCA 2997]|uniref:Peptidase M20 domain-containing protein 2 n=2 Tax=Moniliophthora roreri TaxID=221103 RepID=V2Y123_MONRO|nr:aminoacylase 1-like protein 2 [Moniliophthora roreri MCA 2997]